MLVDLNAVRWRGHGDDAAPLCDAPLLPRWFWLYVEPEPVSGCWIWMGSRTPNGYGRFTLNGRLELAHRVLYEALHGPIANGYELDHLCRLRSCVNPRDIEVVTKKVNILRGESFAGVNARKTQCPSGHPLADENLKIGWRGARICRICERAKSRRYRERNALEPGHEACLHVLAAEPNE